MKKLIILFVVLLLGEFVFPQNKIALVIGNSDYKKMPLKNSKNDAFDLSYTLMSLGFDVILKTNLNHRQMEEAIRQFQGKIMPGDVALFYYSGHGMQLDGLNYLIPVNETINNEIDVKYNCLETGYVLDVMEKARSSVNIIILDACRNNPYEGYRSVSRGFAFMSAPTGSIIVYSTAPGSVAQDGSGRNSPFTESLIEKMKLPGLKIEDVIKEVRRQVAQETGGNQIPWESSSLMGDFYFTSPNKTTSTTYNYNAPKEEPKPPPKKEEYVPPKKEEYVPPKPATVPHESFTGNSGTFTDRRDGHRYNWVRIGSQIWMAENLNVGKMISGTMQQTNNGVIEKYCYDDDESNCRKYGGLYQWDEAMNYVNAIHEQGICPPGWVIPSRDDFLTLMKNNGGKLAGISLKEAGHVYKKSSLNSFQQNSSGFTALMSGIRHYKGTFREMGITALFWSSLSEKEGRSKSAGNGAYRMKLHIESPSMSTYTTDKKYGLSVRCIKK